MSKKRKIYRLHVLLSLSLVYACQATQNLPSANQKPLPLPSSSAQAEPSLSPVPSPTPSPDLRLLSLNVAEIAEVKANPVVAANNRFSLKLFQTLSEAEQEKNLFVSPLSASLVLQMAWNGARGETKAEMAKALEIDNLKPELVKRGASLLMRKLMHPAEDIQLEVANGLFANDRFKLVPEFVQQTQESFLSEVKSMHFKNGPTQTEINAWVSDKTHKLITNIMSPEDESAAAEWENSKVLFLLNAMYFKANWTSRFENFETQDREFTLANGTVKKLPMMRQFNYIKYLRPGYQNLNNHFQAVELPYGQNKNLGMYLFKPDYGRSLQDLHEEFKTIDLETLFSLFFETSGSVVLPKFKLTQETSLSKIMQKMGMQLAFQKFGADFLNMVQPVKQGELTEGDNFCLSDLLQKSFIEVNEEGTKAAVVTYTSVGPIQASSEPQRELEVYFDRPFMYLIRDNETGQILFMGNVYDPSLEN
ncbi:hypothetical protein COW36_08925 [bacterium (Candidatus Blackallbacteria) CG17_big_fil_post_rev_8_21_14_2_50_48_46]|uniref:Serpin domain-containing protein n=1 Tax=bacterium (Candidatus Blackallbacteria) CG17_big_fil_post_rev_8_21_14_2_50_48_46 TaxID=2014261 RepID=A0A2M7G5M2_9BACT|nr:MAG: hypothetical protein COW64_24125 [bacterium (Candidatus Blackallbacteria) CG18_big_fil_WC_8_21_14_2_50_49_26]PIW17291.1 MAG: hypothetical protein COW36_08925 [bacterium (Candidatus Blackallbacteria) CG17_big_fil_post_rev_8_21_14_2_50_48_46]PIW47478.1 MAG: hypothetical protein COW20_12905 [bacterium (Candidatus Blackallbacteria) CG13_big_fil_rev_8_21_14_2_50_49_14]